MQVSGVGFYPYCEPMEIGDEEGVSDLELDRSDDQENIEIDNGKKREKEDVTTHFFDSSTQTKRSRNRKNVQFVDSMPTWEVDYNEIDHSKPYDLTKSATEQGWVLNDSEHVMLCIHPRALRTMPDRDFIYFAQQTPSFSKLRLSNGQEITDFGFCQVILGRQNLTAVDISLAPHFTNNSLFALTNHCPFLRSLSLLKCPQINDHGISVLVQRCKGIRMLSLDWCYGITDNALYEIAKYCPRLLELCLTEGTQFSFTAFNTVLQQCQWIEKLDLWSCTQSTDVWVDAIIDWCPNIKVLNLKYCINITPQAIYRLKARFPTLDLTY